MPGVWHKRSTAFDSESSSRLISASARCDARNAVRAFARLSSSAARAATAASVCRFDEPPVATTAARSRPRPRRSPARRTRGPPSLEPAGDRRVVERNDDHVFPLEPSDPRFERGGSCAVAPVPQSRWKSTTTTRDSFSITFFAAASVTAVWGWSPVRGVAIDGLADAVLQPSGELANSKSVELGGADSGVVLEGALHSREATRMLQEPQDWINLPFSLALLDAASEPRSGELWTRRLRHHFWAWPSVSTPYHWLIWPPPSCLPRA